MRRGKPGMIEAFVQSGWIHPDVLSSFVGLEELVVMDRQIPSCFKSCLSKRKPESFLAYFLRQHNFVHANPPPPLVICQSAKTSNQEFVCAFPLGQSLTTLYFVQSHHVSSRKSPSLLEVIHQIRLLRSET